MQQNDNNVWVRCKVCVYANIRNNVIYMEAKKTKEEKQKEWQDFLAKLKTLPPEKLSKAAKWFLANEGRDKGGVIVDMKAVLK